MLNFSKKLRKWIQRMSKYSSGVKSRSLVKHKDFQQINDWGLADWLLYHQREIVYSQVRWMGIPTTKNVLDAWIYQEIIYEVQPEIVIEIGSYNGGSTLYFANLLELLKKGKVVSIDMSRDAYKVSNDRIIEITGESSSQEVLNKVYEISANKTVLVVHDADHHCDQVLRDLNNYAPLVSVGSYFIVEDGIVDIFSPGNNLG